MELMLINSEASTCARLKMKPIQQNIKEQRGVVLVVALVFLIALTAVASTLMLNTTTDVKMSGASEERVVAIEETISAVDELFYRQINPLEGGGNAFASPIAVFQNQDVPLLDSLTKTQKNVTEATLGLANNKYAKPMTCPHSLRASSVGVLECNILRVQVSKTYGRKNNNVVEVESGVTQVLLPN